MYTQQASPRQDLQVFKHHLLSPSPRLGLAMERRDWMEPHWHWRFLALAMEWQDAHYGVQRVHHKYFLGPPASWDHRPVLHALGPPASSFAYALGPPASSTPPSTPTSTSSESRDFIVVEEPSLGDESCDDSFLVLLGESTCLVQHHSTHTNAYVVACDWDWREQAPLFQVRQSVFWGPSADSVWTGQRHMGSFKYAMDLVQLLRLASTCRVVSQL